MASEQCTETHLPSVLIADYDAPLHPAILPFDLRIFDLTFNLYSGIRLV